MLKQFGARPSPTDIARYSTCPNWNGDSFENIEYTTIDIRLSNLPGLLYKQFCEKSTRFPSRKLDVAPFHINEFNTGNQGMKAVWYGHSAILMKLSGVNILIDPMFSSNAAPVSPFPVRRFSENTLDVIDALPVIDLVLISHDHYDHLDYESILKLRSKAKHFYVALGVARHLKKWGIEENSITEFHWWEQKRLHDLTITFTPTRHFSGRGLRDRAKSLWGGWALKSPDANVFFSGDSGYGNHFREIGNNTI